MIAEDLSTLAPDRIEPVARRFEQLLTTHTLDGFVRLMHARHATDPLGFGPGGTRFSAPPDPLAHRSARLPFRVLYVTEDLSTAVFEKIVRDRFDLVSTRALEPSDYHDHCVANVSTAPRDSLTLLDLTRGGAARAGVPTDVIGHSKHSAGQFFSAFVHANIPHADGLLYHSRFTTRSCIAIYDRVRSKLDDNAPVYPLTCGMLSVVLHPWRIDVR